MTGRDAPATVVTVDVLAAVVAALGTGAVAGRALREVLARMRRGVVVGRGWCEAGVAGGWAVTAAAVATGRLDPGWAPVLLGVAVLAVAGSATDVLAHRLPDALTLPAAPATLVLLVPVGAEGLVRGFVGAAVLGVAHAGVHLAAPGALGAGDVKLAPAVGAALGAVSWGLLALVPAVAAAGLAAATALTGRRSLPLGPALLTTTWVVLAAAVIG